MNFNEILALKSIFTQDQESSPSQNSNFTTYVNEPGMLTR